MHSSNTLRRSLLVIITAFVPVILFAQGGIKWNRTGNGYYQFEKGELDLYTLPQQAKTVIISKTQLTPPGTTTPLNVQSFSFTADVLKDAGLVLG